MASSLDRIEGWYVDVLTFDLDDDGDLDAIATDTNSDGPWVIHRFDSTGWSAFVPSRAHRDDPSQYLSSQLSCRSCSFFAISNRNESARLMCIELPRYGDDETPQTPDNSLGFTTLVSLTEDGAASFVSIPGGRESLLSTNTFASIQRILPVEFTGTNVVETEREWYGYANLPAACLRTVLVLSETERAALRASLNASGETNSEFCIVFDADGDGLSDAYVSVRTNLPQTAESEWSLWRQTTNGWFPANDPVENKSADPLPDPNNPGHILTSYEWDVRVTAPVVHASTLDFYRVYRPDGTTWPAVFPRTTNGSLPGDFHGLFKTGAAFMRLERIAPENLMP